MASPTTAPPVSKKTGFDPAQKAWLSRQLGVEVPWNANIEVDGAPQDTREALKKVKEFDEELAKGTELDESKKAEIAKIKEALAAAGIPGVAEKADDFETARQAKDEALKKVRDLLELQKAEISKTTDLKYVVKREGLPGSTTKRTKTQGNEVDKQYSEVHDGDRRVAGKGPTDAQLQALKLVMDQLMALTNEIRDNGDAKFTPNELMEEIWTPLVRERIISEDQCPQEFSRVLQLWEGANALYRERCAVKAREEEERFATARGLLQDADEVLGIGASVVDVVLSIVGTGPKAKEILELATKCARAGANLLSNALAKDLKGCTTNIGAILGAAVPEPWGDVSKAAFLTVANTGLVVKKLSERSNGEAGDLIGDALEAAFGVIGSSISAKTKDDKFSKIFDTVGAQIKSKVSSGMAGKEIFDLLQATPVNTKLLLAKIGAIVDTEVKQGTKDLVKFMKHYPDLLDLKEKLEKEGLAEGDPEYDRQVKELTKEQEGETEKIEGIDIAGITKNLSELIGTAPDPEAIEKLAIEAGAEQTNAELEEAHETYCKSLSLAMGVGVGADDEDMALLSDLYDIDKLIAQIEADKAQIALLNGILDAVGGVVTLIVPQLGGVLKAKQFAMNVVAAVRRSQELCTFTALVSDAKKAASPQAFALLAQVSELKRQLTNDVIDAAVALGQAILITGAAAADLSGYGAAAGAALKAANGALEAFAQAKDFLSRKFQERKVKRAWAKYRKALDNPRDRVLVVKSLKSNATLAKYAVAYGALEMNDPFAREALRSCNLNDAVLADENTSAEKVVRFLEAKFSDDIQVVGVVTRFAPEAGAPMTLASWMANKEAASNPKNNFVLKSPSPTASIDNGFKLVETSAKVVVSLDISTVDTYDEWVTHSKNLMILATALDSYTPLATGPTGDREFPEFKDYLNDLSAAAKSESRKTLAAIEGDKAARVKAALNFKKTTTAAKRITDAIGTAQSAVGSTTGRSVQDITDYSTGAGAELMKVLKAASKEAPSLVGPASLLIKSLSLMPRRAEAAGKLGDPDKANRVKEILDQLVAELNETTTKISELGTNAETSMLALGPDAQPKDP
ncbi:hypothetical protein Psta_1841 [Pirellula staleyi DSM 6068]|uniref:Uncharacterized protein n=1 Tax=Pirellula staleyi (strain ATCC 27377 / DSM 6068 / ICPB 4128) TaxID=530564 RepID=D2QZN2_PIRSD|nr:hypothetical protein [Pirellula staleyi]ADB16515.1 hypothetical protein Psta_1841 [Pirellula staleyi DSM 6068]